MVVHASTNLVRRVLQLRFFGGMNRRGAGTRFRSAGEKLKMQDKDILIGPLMEETWLTLKQVAAACYMEPQRLLAHIKQGLFPHAEGVAGVWRFSAVSLLRARRMRRIERGCDAVLVEMDALRLAGGE